MHGGMGSGFLLPEAAPPVAFAPDPKLVCVGYVLYVMTCDATSCSPVSQPVPSPSLALAYLQLHLKRPALVGEKRHDAVVRVGRVDALDVVDALLGEHALVRVVRHGLRAGAEARHVVAPRPSGDRVRVADAARLLEVVKPRVRRRRLEDHLQLGAGRDEADCPEEGGHEAERAEGPHRGGFRWGGGCRWVEEGRVWASTLRAADRLVLLGSGGIALTRRRFRWAAVPSWFLDFKSRWLVAWWVLMTLHASHKARRRFHRKNKRPKRAFRKKNLDPAKRMS